jgi:hypothetical protein
MKQSRKKGFDMPAARRLEIERYARAVGVAETEDFRSFLVAWQWHNRDSKDTTNALIMAAQRMGGNITPLEAEQVIEEADTVPNFRKADALGRYLHLTDENRTALQIRTIGSIDVSKQRRVRLRKERARARRRAKRRISGAKSRAEYLAANSLSRIRPWKTEGVSRRTWYRRRNAAARHGCVDTHAPVCACASRTEPTPPTLLPIVSLCLQELLLFGQPLYSLSICTSVSAMKKEGVGPDLCHVGEGGTAPGPVPPPSLAGGT